MDRQRVADALEEIGLLLELQGANPFKTRAYANAARVLRGLDEEFERLLAPGRMTRVKGIGPAIAEKIVTLATTGRLPYLERLRAEIPPGLLEWLRIPGLGPKKARAIWIGRGLTTLDELEHACREGRLRELEGFGEVTERKILAGIERLRSHAGRFLQPVVQAAAERLLARVRSAPGVIHAEAAGSVRRRAETSKDIDIVASAAASEPVMEAFAGAPGIVEVTGRGPTKCSVRLTEGPAADLRVVEEASWPAALVYFTGSKAHNIALRARAQRLGFKLNEYALAREDVERAVPCKTEEDLYRALGLAWIPPELREDEGEIEAAEAGTLPGLVAREDLRGILHCHTSWSDGAATLGEMADAARALGMSYLAVCDHSQSAAYAGGLGPDRVREQWQAIDALNRKYDGAFRLVKGTEVDILPDGRLDYPDDLLAGFELVIASIHGRFDLPAREQTERLLKAIDNPWVDMIGHVSGRLLLSRAGYPLDLHAVLEAAARRGVAVEINAHPQRLDLDWHGLRYGIARGLKTAINPDAHSTESLEDVRYGLGTARKGWCTPEDVLNAWSVERLLAHLSERRARALGSRPGHGR